MPAFKKWWGEYGFTVYGGGANLYKKVAKAAWFAAQDSCEVKTEKRTSQSLSNDELSERFDKPNFSGREILCPYCDKRWDPPSASMCTKTEECGCGYCAILQHVLDCRSPLDELSHVWLEIARLKAANLNLLEAMNELLDCTCQRPCSCGAVEVTRGIIARARGEK